LDESETFEALKHEVAHFRDERDWLQFHTAKDLSAAISIESAELQELFLWKSQKELESTVNDPTERTRISEEMADVGIYLLGLSDVLRIDLSEAIRDKLRKNEMKYPVKRSKGSNRKYSDQQP
jgi:NTP pyrophosphatase (non-canonical NTP hydrolase)